MEKVGKELDPQIKQDKKIKMQLEQIGTMCVWVHRVSAAKSQMIQPRDKAAGQRTDINRAVKWPNCEMFFSDVLHSWRPDWRQEEKKPLKKNLEAARAWRRIKEETKCLLMADLQLSFFFFSQDLINQCEDFITPQIHLTLKQTPSN